MTGNLPKTMKAWVFSRPGKPTDVLSLKKAWPMPAAPKSGEIMVKVSYASINPVDNAFMGMNIPFRGNAIPGMDFVGEVIQVGRPSTSTSVHWIPTVGTTVAGCIPVMSALRGAGTLAEYVTVSAQAVAQKPNEMDESLAAGLMGIAGQTSATILRHARLGEGDKVLINGASGGVGTILVHVLSAMGIHVTGICSGRNAAIVQSLGAGAVVDYTAAVPTVDALIASTSSSNGGLFDAIIDCVGNDEIFFKSPAYLKSDGRFLTIAGNLLSGLKNRFLPVVLGGVPRGYMSIMGQTGDAAAREVAGWFAKGLITSIPADSIFEMDQAAQAYETLATKRAVGKILVRV